MSLTEQQIELQVQKGIRQAEDELVILIEKALSTSFYRGLEESQFRNLVRVADTTDSAEVIKNFLRYQVGRDKKWGRGNESLAERIITDIGNSDRASKLAEIANTIAQSSDLTKFKYIWLELIQRYLGYGSRHLKYLNLVIPQKIHEIEKDLESLMKDALNKTSSGELKAASFNKLIRTVDDIDSAESAETLPQSLRNQISQDKGWGKGSNSLAERITADIGDVKQGGKLIDIARQISHTANVTEFKPIWLELIHRYLKVGSRSLNSSKGDK